MNKINVVCTTINSTFSVLFLKEFFCLEKTLQNKYKVFMLYDGKNEEDVIELKKYKNKINNLELIRTKTIVNYAKKFFKNKNVQNYLEQSGTFKKVLLWFYLINKKKINNILVTDDDVVFLKEFDYSKDNFYQESLLELVMKKEKSIQENFPELLEIFKNKKNTKYRPTICGNFFIKNVNKKEFKNLFLNFLSKDIFNSGEILKNKKEHTYRNGNFFYFDSVFSQLWFYKLITKDKDFKYMEDGLIGSFEKYTLLNKNIFLQKFSTLYTYKKFLHYNFGNENKNKTYENLKICIPLLKDKMLKITQ